MYVQGRSQNITKYVRTYNLNGTYDLANCKMHEGFSCGGGTGFGLLCIQVQVWADGCKSLGEVNMSNKLSES